MDDNINQAKSWGELLRAQEQSRKELAWKPEKQEPVKYVTRYEVSRKERAFDPVLQKFSDQTHESNLQSQEHESRVRLLNRRKVQELNKVNHYNVINHEPILPGVRAVEERRKETMTASSKIKKQQSRTGYNIISNLDLADHNYVAPELRPSRIPEKTRTQSFADRRSSHPDFDIISNRYRTHHDIKVATDLEAEKRLAAQRFWEKRNFDPITCKFYDPKKEDFFHEKRVEIEQEHGKDFWKKLPKTLREAELRKYDIVSMQPRGRATSNQGTSNQTTDSNIQESSGSGSNIRATMERSQQEYGAIRSRLDDRRKANRCTPERHRQMHAYEHGYDIVNTKPFVGRLGIAKPLVRGSSRKSLWNRLEQQRAVNPNV